MFSATFPDDVQKIAGKYLHDYVFVTTGNIGGMNPDVCQEFHEVQRQDKRNKLVEILRDLGNSRVIVFVESKKTADFIAAFLANTQFQVCIGLHFPVSSHDPHFVIGNKHSR